MAEITMTVLSWFILVLGLSYLLQSENWIRLAQSLEQETFRFYPTSLFILILGLLIVTTHNIWDWKWHIIITLLGWIMVVKSVLYLLCTSWIDKMMMTARTMRVWIRVSGLLFSLLGIVLVYQSLPAR